ncbi:MAG TPA: hypothetical protein VGE72_10270 [Azospirillum sp.]
MKRRNTGDPAKRTDGTGGPLRRIARVTLAGALALPLLVACGEEEVAEEPAATPPATAEAPATTAKPPAPAGVPGAIESTDRAIQAVPPAEPGKQ